MSNKIMYDFYPHAVERECLHAYEVYCITEDMFMRDCKGLGLDKKLLRKSVKDNLQILKIALLKNGGSLENFFSDHLKEIEGEKEGEKLKLTSFLYELYNILVMAVYLYAKYSLKIKNSKLDRQLLSNNLAISIIEGSAIGKYDRFNPYIGRSYLSQKREVEEGVYSAAQIANDNKKNRYDDFYHVQNSFLLHQLLMLVVLSIKSKTFSVIKHTKNIGQKNIINDYTPKNSDNFEDSYLDDQQWSSSLMNIITHFDSIMKSLKNSKERPLRIKLANIYFSKDFIDNYDYDELLQSYNFTEDLLVDKIPTETQITTTIGRIIAANIRKYTNKEKSWSHVKSFMKFFPYRASEERNLKIDISDGEDIYIFNHKDTFGITIRDYPIEDISKKKLTYEELQNKYKKPAKNHATAEGKDEKVKDEKQRNKFSILLKKENTSQVKRGKAEDIKFLSRRANTYFLNTYIFISESYRSPKFTTAPTTLNTNQNIFLPEPPVAYIKHT